MFKKILSRIFGICIARCSLANADKFADILRTNDITTEPIKFDADGCSVILSEFRSKKLLCIAEDKGLEIEIERLFGIPYLLDKYKYRPGILVGAVIFISIVMLSGNIIWDFEITGNTYVSDTEIIESLEKFGCYSGAFVDDIDFDLLQNNCLIDSDNLAWISVNMDGNLARVEVREKRCVPLENPPVKGKYANIVAAEDGVIELCRIRNGKAAVEVGDVVKKGELLISGVIDVGETDVRYEYADGEIFAKIYREISVHVPYDYTECSPTGKKVTDRTIKIFGKSIKLSHRGSIDWPVYGKIKEEEKISLPFGISLPIWVSRTVYSEQTETKSVLTEKDALSKARTEAMTKLKDISATVQVLSVAENVTKDSSGVCVTLGVYGVTDISANYGFFVSDSGMEENEDKPQNEENGNG